jgi:uncharacterized coiled-coil DUF342 family protein
MSGAPAAGGAPPVQKIDQIQTELNKAKGVMKQNIDKTIQRGEKLDQLGDKAETLSSQASRFQNNAKTLRRQMCWQNYRNLFILIAVMIVN